MGADDAPAPPTLRLRANRVLPYLAAATDRPHLLHMDITVLEKLLAAGQDNLMLRFGLGSAYLKQDDYDRAVDHLRAALRHDPAHSASHKLLGKALAAADRNDEAVAAYEEGIRIAQEKGDIQAAKEMRVFLKRLQTPRA